MIENTSLKKNIDWLFGRNPNKIEEQEKEGQDQLVNTSNEEISQLPSKVNHSSESAEDIYKSLGFEVIQKSKGDDLFLDVKLKSGWKIKRTDHPMWSNLVDPFDNIRTDIFYKAAFYDRSSFINPLLTRYYISYDYADENCIETKNFNQWVRVKDRKTGEILFQRDGEPVDTGKFKESDLQESCIEFLNKNFKNWENPLMYWEE